MANSKNGGIKAKTRTKTVTGKGARVTSRENNIKANAKSSTRTSAKTSTRSTNTVRVNDKKRPRAGKFREFCIAAGLIVLPVVVGLVATALTGDTMMKFGQFNQPPLAPPAWLFPVAWTVLYLLMGVASYLIIRAPERNKADSHFKKAEIVVYSVQLFFNFMWTLIFFKFDAKVVAFVWLIVMWLMILVLIIMTAHNRKAAMWCLIPYILWCTFAAYLNISIVILN